MERIYVLSDKEEYVEKIKKHIDDCIDYVKFAGNSISVAKGLVEIGKIKPEMIVVYMKNVGNTLNYLKTYNHIVIVEEELKEKNRNYIHIEEFKEYIKKNYSKSTNTIKTPKKTDIVIIGVSTGGPNALKKVIPKLKENVSVPLIVVQHMPPGFTAELAKSLNMMSKLKVKEAEKGETLEKGNVYVSPGGKNIGVKKIGSSLKVDFYDEKYGFYTPSVDYTIETVNKLENINPLIVIMTGMGKDGLDGIRNMKKNDKGFVITQSKETCVVYGMPKSVDELDFSDLRGVNLDDIANEINKRV